ncbi:MAG: hypothetical protein ABI771_07195 [Betaproteobacteria bacterium]
MNKPSLMEEHEPLSLGQALLREDPQYERIPVGHRVLLVGAALDDGRSVASRIARLWGSEPAGIAARRNIPVVESDANGGYGSVVVYATYTSGPQRITLHRPAIARLSAFAQAHISEFPAGLRMDAAALDIAAIKSIFIAHELYHHFDCLRGNARLSRRHAVKIFSIGPWKWTSGLSSLGEIAAGAFAQRLLGLPFHPALLDVLFKQETMNHGEHGEHGGHGEEREYESLHA